MVIVTMLRWGPIHVSVKEKASLRRMLALGAGGRAVCTAFYKMGYKWVNAKQVKKVLLVLCK